MKYVIITALTVFLFQKGVHAQTTTVDGYVQTGLESNLALQENTILIEKSFYALAEARGLFYPTVSFQSDYNYASGGRKIALPLGDLFNPIYGSLNQMGQGNYNPIANQTIPFMANDFQDTRLTATLQLINTDIKYNYMIKKEAINAQKAGILVYKRELVKQIKMAYYQVLNLFARVDIYRNAETLLEENLRVTTRMVENGKSLKANILKINADVNDNAVRITDLENQLKVAKAYLNFLINQPFETEVTIDTASYNSTAANPGIAPNPDLAADAMPKREELNVAESNIRQSEFRLKADKSFFVPNVYTYLSSGFQGTGYNFGRDQRYISGGVTLKWNLFNGNQHLNRIKQTKADLKMMDLDLVETANKMKYQLLEAESALATARKKLKSTEINVDYATEYYRQINTRYKLGMVLLIELTEAQNRQLDAKTAHQQALTEVLIKQAELERTAATYQL